DDPDRILAEPDRRKHAAGAWPRPARLFQLDAVRPRRARGRHCLYADARAQHAEQAADRRRRRTRSTECDCSVLLIWPRRQMAPPPGPTWFTPDRSLDRPDAIARPARPCSRRLREASARETTTSAGDARDRVRSR